MKIKCKGWVKGKGDAYFMKKLKSDGNCKIQILW